MKPRFGPGRGVRSAVLSAALGVIFAAPAALAAARTTTAADRPIAVFFRYDDLSGRSPLDLERRLVDSFRKHKIAFTAGIIPSAASDESGKPVDRPGGPLGEDKIAFLRDALADGTIEPALHGLSHENISTPRGVPSEFAGASAEDQRAKIAKGLAFLERELDVPVKIFIPPWNSNDRTTLRVLEDLGFDWISSSGDTVSDAGSSLRILPATCYVPQLRWAVEAARGLPCGRTDIVVLFHPDEFAESNSGEEWYTYAEFEELLAWIASQPDIELTTIGRLANPGAYGMRRFEANKPFFLVQRYLPPKFLRLIRYRGWIYRCESDLSRARMMPWLIFSGFFLLLVGAPALLVFLGGRRFVPPHRWLRGVFGGIAWAGAAFILFYVFRDHYLSPKGLTVIGAAVGLALGVSLAVLFPRRRKR